MNKAEFIERLRTTVEKFAEEIQNDNGEWMVKGFIDTNRDIYTISTDTKVVSKIVELYIFPKIQRFAQENGLTLELAQEQNHYPDMTFIDEENNLFAVDIKSSYRKTDRTINGMTLGAFTGYFRDRESIKNVTHPYGNYKAHIVLGIIYSLNEECGGELEIHRLSNLDNIRSVIKDFQFFVQEKWKIATDRPGSGNTKNIGSVNNIDDLIEGRGTFADYGEDVFNEYWMNYLTNDMARRVQLQRPYYTNLREYLRLNLNGANDNG